MDKRRMASLLREYVRSEYALMHFGEIKADPAIIATASEYAEEQLDRLITELEKLENG